MTRKHYIMVAKAISNQYSHPNATNEVRAALIAVVKSMSESFAYFNANFDREKFENLCFNN